MKGLLLDTDIVVYLFRNKNRIAEGCHQWIHTMFMFQKLL